MRIRRKGAVFAVNMAIVTVLVALLTGLSIFWGMERITAWKCDAIRHEAMMIDNALRKYAESHRSVYTVSAVSSSSGEQSLRSKALPSYPKSLAELGTLRDSYGYLPSVTLGNSKGQINLAKFNYTPISTKSGSSEYYYSYKLTVNLPNGTVYTSPGSNNTPEMSWNW